MPAALITGGGTGIGRAAAVALAARGWNVLVGGRRSEPLKGTVALLAPGAGAWHAGDISNPDVATGMVSATVATFGGLDLLVNNAGTAQPGELSTTSTDDIAAMVDVNLKGTLYVTRAAIGPLTERRGRIVNIGSVGGIGASRVSSVYGATKAAVHHLTTCLARELAPRGIAVNTIVPGPVQTEIIDARLMKRLAASTLLGRVGQPEDVATWIVALAAPDADWVTGAQLTVDGGFSIGP